MDAAIQHQEGQVDHRARVLVLDPDPRVSEALALALRKVAHVEHATRGVAGLIAVAEGPVDAVIAQADLPDIFTGELVRLLRVLRPRVPIAILGERRAPLAWPDYEVEARFSGGFDLRRCVNWVLHCTAHLSPARAAREGASVPEVSLQHAEIVHWVLAYIERRHRDGTRLTTIARMAGVSRSHLCRIFRRVTGETLKRFLIRRRIEEAKALLRNPSLTIQQVASAVGYRDLSHFDRVFRRWEGQSPSQHRYHVLMKSVRQPSETPMSPWRSRVPNPLPQ